MGKMQKKILKKKYSEIFPSQKNRLLYGKNHVFFFKKSAISDTPSLLFTDHSFY